jgi:cyclase
MLRPRVIPCLLVHDGGLVKTVNFANPTYVGDPINAVRIFNEKECDELTVLDIDASVNGAEPDYRLIAQLAIESRMPLCYGGGVCSVEQAKRIVGLGCEKVSISSAAVRNPGLIGEIADAVGRQSVVVTIDAKRAPGSAHYGMFTHNGRTRTGRDALDFAEEAIRHGAGEIVMNCIDLDGRMTGYDLDLARQLQGRASVPITMLGGAGSLDDLRALFAECGIVGAGAGSLFVFKGKFRAVLINYPDPPAKAALFRPTA